MSQQLTHCSPFSQNFQFPWRQPAQKEKILFQMARKESRSRCFKSDIDTYIKLNGLVFFVIQHWPSSYFDMSYVSVLCDWEKTVISNKEKCKLTIFTLQSYIKFQTVKDSNNQIKQLRYKQQLRYTVCNLNFVELSSHWALENQCSVSNRTLLQCTVVRAMMKSSSGEFESSGEI